MQTVRRFVVDKLLPVTVRVHGHTDDISGVIERKHVFADGFLDKLAANENYIVFDMTDRGKLQEYSERRFGFHFTDMPVLFVFSIIEWFAGAASLQTQEYLRRVVQAMQAVHAMDVTYNAEIRLGIIRHMKDCVNSYNGRVTLRERVSSRYHSQEEEEEFGLLHP